MRVVLVLFSAFFLMQCGKQVETPDIKHEEVTYKADTLTMKGYLAYDAAIEGKRPGILVVHEWWGHNEYARKRADMLAELGYAALAVDMYGDGKKADHPADAMKFASQVMQNVDQAKVRFLAGLEKLKSYPFVDPDKIAAIGYCFGGGVVLHMARMGVDLDGVVSFHGSIATQMPAEKDSVKAQILVCNGADDSFVTQEQIDAFKQEMDSAGVSYQFINYPGAKHSFTNPEADAFAKKFDMPLAYNAKADTASWEDMETFLQKIFSSK